MCSLRVVLLTSALVAITAAHKNHETGSVRGNNGYLPNAYEDPVIISDNPSSAPSTWVRFRSNAANYYWDGGKPNHGVLTMSARKAAPRSQSQNARNWNPSPYVNNYRGDSFANNDEASVSGFGLFNMGRSWAIYNMNWDNSNAGSYLKR